MNSRSASGAFVVFVASLLAVPMAGNVTTFLFAWELMALSSLALVAHDHARRREAIGAARWYAVMTQGGAAAITIALVGLANHAHSTRFDVIASAPRLSGALASTFFLFALAGFASKAGVVPLHVWLPKAHAEAPGPVSALMSGAMVNLGVYGIILVGRTMLAGGPQWWWLVVSLLGGLTAVVGALYAATSRDLKRLLAYSTADNMGLVLLALGASGLSLTTHHPKVSALALATAGVLLVNHALFKSTLFLGAGAVAATTGSRNMDELGGLARLMPLTSATFLVGALAVSAIPPLNGFTGEWLLFQSLLHSLAAHGVASVVAGTLAVAAMALTGGLTVIAFVKAFGITFLGRGRSAHALNAHEVTTSMRVSELVLALACVATGVAPYVVVSAVSRAFSPLAAPSISGWSTLRFSGLSGALTPIYLTAALAGVVALLALWRHLSARRRGFAPVATLEAWGSGRHHQTAHMQYTATSYGEPILRVFDDVLRPDRDVDVSHVVESRYYLERIRYRTSSEDIVERLLYRPVLGILRAWARRARVIANGSVHRYLAYGLAALVVILVILK
jgi:formate hydrogenlyase subunit 3/multisubunit Na+/H+ antiporter MnhD subunit